MTRSALYGICQESKVAFLDYINLRFVQSEGNSQSSSFGVLFLLSTFMLCKAEPQSAPLLVVPVMPVG